MNTNPKNTEKKEGPATPDYIIKNVKKYLKQTVRRTSFLVYEDAEPEIFALLESQDNVSKYLRSLIAGYIENPVDLEPYMESRGYNKGPNARYNFLVNKNKHPEMIEVLEQQDSISEFMKALIRLELERESA